MHTGMSAGGGYTGVVANVWRGSSAVGKQADSKHLSATAFQAGVYRLSRACFDGAQGKLCFAGCRRGKVEARLEMILAFFGVSRLSSPLLQKGDGCYGVGSLRVQICCVSALHPAPVSAFYNAIVVDIAAYICAAHCVQRLRKNACYQTGGD